MIWLALFLIGVGLAVPHWLGIAPKNVAAERRFIARMVVVGLIAGLVFSTLMTLMRQHIDFDLRSLLVILKGGALGAVVGLVGASRMQLMNRRRATRQNSEQAG